MYLVREKHDQTTPSGKRSYQSMYMKKTMWKGKYRSTKIIYLYEKIEIKNDNAYQRIVKMSLEKLQNTFKLST